MLGKLDVGRGMFVLGQLSRKRQELLLLDRNMHSLPLLMGTILETLQRTF
jgi:hypothetical protein